MSLPGRPGFLGKRSPTNGRQRICKVMCECVCGLCEPVARKLKSKCTQGCEHDSRGTHACLFTGLLTGDVSKIYVESARAASRFSRRGCCRADLQRAKKMEIISTRKEGQPSGVRNSLCSRSNLAQAHQSEQSKQSEPPKQSKAKPKQSGPIRRGNLS